MKILHPNSIIITSILIVFFLKTTKYIIATIKYENANHKLENYIAETTKKNEYLEKELKFLKNDSKHYERRIKEKFGVLGEHEIEYIKREYEEH
jgi:hypothetical protein